ncbi:DNA-directed RNA polymerase subunit delta [Mollicutes bacterium LVI A0078]|nr:DNA-directed RNA polymerase subunit delta [Mollicutes bacterium LVI A0075]WOO90914.1 DNA-directed RNA polymerase subunit delta [Mollicutes bacterium LVI A0078]
MKVSIIEYIINKINESGEAVDLRAIVDEIGFENYNFESKEEMIATIYTDLMVDGRFVMVEDKWDLQEKYTMIEIRKHRSMQLGTTISDYLNDDGEVIEDDEEENTPVHSTDDDDNVINVDESLSDFLSDDELED